MAQVVGTNQFRNGMHIELDGGVWRIVEFQHVKPGKGGAFVRTKVKNLDTGAVVDRTFRAGEKFPRVHTEVKNMQYLYESGDEVVFMDQETYEQTALPRQSIADAIAFMEPSSSVQMLTVDGQPAGVVTLDEASHASEKFRQLVARKKAAKKVKKVPPRSSRLRRWRWCRWCPRRLETSPSRY